MLMFVANCEADVTCSGKGTCKMDDGTCNCNGNYAGDNCNECKENYFGADCMSELILYKFIFALPKKYSNKLLIFYFS